MFGRRYFLDPDVEAFHVKCWGWLLRNRGAEDFGKSPLVLPTTDFFPLTDAQGHARATHIFNQVRKITGMEDWPVSLVPQAERAGRVASVGNVQHTGAAAGTFSHSGNSGKVTYDPALIKKPVALIAVFAHELGHYICENIQEDPPGGWDLLEPATDVTACYLGFGVFSANAAFDLTNHTDFDSQGWQSNKLGYLTEAEWSFNIALFCALRGIDHSLAKPHLKAHLFNEVKKAAAYAAKHDLATAIRTDAARRS